jgi:hypothetical protein
LFHWYANFKKKVASGGGKYAEQSVVLGVSPEAEEYKERLLMLQKHFLVL